MFIEEDNVSDVFNLERFVDAQERAYSTALSEIKVGRKRSHWVWYIFPQLKQLGRSTNAKYYGISGKEEATAYLSHDILGTRLREISHTLLSHQGKSVDEILGGLDAMKVCSSMTLFDTISPQDIYADVLDKFYEGKRCDITINLLRGPSDICSALNYIGVAPEDFALRNEMFARPIHQPIHGIGHIYRTMIGCALLGQLLQKQREALLAFCGAFVHDLARENDGVDSEHGANAALKYFDKFNHIWDKYQLTTQERDIVKQAVEQHSTREWMRCGDVGYDVMAILKDADALDRCRIGDLDSQWLRYRDSRLLIHPIEEICDKTYSVNDDIDFSSFIQLIS